jgi:hypothetical protein
MMLLYNLPVHWVPLWEPGKVGGQHRPPPPEQPHKHADEGEGEGPGPGGLMVGPLPVQFPRHPGVVGGCLRQLPQQLRHALLQQLKEKLFCTLICDDGC